MKSLCLALLSFCLLSYGNAIATTFSDRNFDQDHMILNKETVLILSAFEDEDHITCYTHSGHLLWNVNINPKIISWKLENDHLFVFSKARDLEKTYLHCIEPKTGLINWERF